VEVFIAFSDDGLAPLVEKTMEAWGELDWAEPISVVQLRPAKFEINRRVLADQMAKDKWYILTDVGQVLEGNRSIPIISSRLTDEGMIGFAPSLLTPIGVRVCQKGIVTRWIEKQTSSYDWEHAQCVINGGKEVAIWSDISCQQIRGQS